MFLRYLLQCKRDASRALCFDLLKIICNRNAQALQDVVKHLTDLHSYRTELSSKWNYAPSDARIASCGYVGLKNLV